MGWLYAAHLFAFAQTQRWRVAPHLNSGQKPSGSGVCPRIRSTRGRYESLGRFPGLIVPIVLKRAQ
jgi:hypothetical protein